MQSPGWYLGLRYMQGTGLVARVGEKIGEAHRGADFIFADRVLCEARNWRAVLSDWWDALTVGGHLILWLPDCRHHDLARGEAKLTLDDVEHALDHKSGWLLRESDLIDGFIYAVWQKRRDEAQIRAPWRKQEKHLLIARMGAHGDALMASSILPWLKSKGWTISFISRNAGCDVLKHDPHIDELILLAAGQVKEEELPHYWQAWQKRFDRFINLAHSVEGDLLKQPGRADYHWSDEQRRALCDRSYLGYLHRLAGVPKPYRVRFYPSAEEEIWARQKAKEFSVRQDRSSSSPLAGEVRRGGERLRTEFSIGDISYGCAPPTPTLPSRGREFDRSQRKDGSKNSGGFILWCLRGSAVHKWWPYGPQAICRLLAKTDLNIILTGDAGAGALAQEILTAAGNYHGDTWRVHTMCGTHSIRQIMALAHNAAAVVGPETGVMNAVSMQKVPKILLLSHSSAKNLSDDWINTTALAPQTSCYPCHRLHFDHSWCPQDEATGAAACAANITAEQVVDAVMNYTGIEHAA